MTAKILPFPAEPAPQSMEGVVRKHLAEISADERLVETVTGRMMDFIETYTGKTFDPVFELALPHSLPDSETAALLASIEESVDRAALAVERMICEIILERLFYEVAVYRYKKKHAREKSLSPL